MTLALTLAPFLEAVQPGGVPSPSPTPVSPFPAINFPYWWLLSATIWGPVLLALVMAFIPEVRRRDLRLFYGFAFWTTVGVFLLTLFAYNQANQFVPGLQYEENWPWMPPFGISYHLAADGVSIPLLMVSALIAVLAVLASANVRERPRQYFVLLLLTEAAVNGTIAAHDLFVLTLFWGAATLPLALLVWGWGGPRRVRAAIRLVTYSALGLAALAGAIFVLYAATGGASFDMEYAAKTALSPRAQFVISVLLLLAAAVRLPLVPFHGGLRDLFSEAPAGVAVLTAGALSRTGGYLLIRVMVSDLHDGSRVVAPLAGALAVVTVGYAALVAFRAVDLRRFGAYAALVPGGVFALGIAGLTPMAVLGSAFQLIAGGLAAALVVAVAAVIAERAQTREMAVLRGLGPRMPRLGWLLLLGSLALVGVPGTATFIAELLEFLGSFYTQPGAAFLVGAGLALVAAALAWTVQRVLFGRPAGDAPGASDSGLTETWYLGILVAALLWWGILPGGPKIGGSVVLFDQGIVNVINNSSSDLTSVYAPPDRTAGKPAR